MTGQSLKMYEIINDQNELRKFESVDIFAKCHSGYKLFKAKYNDKNFSKRESDYLNKRLFITLEDRIKLIREKQYQLNFTLKSSMKVDMVKAKEILTDLMEVSLSEPRSEVLIEMGETVKVIVDEYLKNPNIVTYLAKISVHDYSTQLHLINVMLYCMGYAYFNELGRDDIKLYGLIGLMHDIGKVTIPDYLLQAPRKLTEKEFIKIQKHTKTGWEMLRTCDFDVRVRIGAHEHHERLDGSGYPNGKIGRDLCEISRMLAIVDIFEALTTWRPYKNKEPLKPFNALQVIKQGVLLKKLDSTIFKRFAYSIVGITSPEFDKSLL